MDLYHGSNLAVERPRLLPHQRALDFGRGFYVTSDLRQAERWARSVARRRGGSPTVCTYQLSDESWDELDVLRFEEPDGAWLDFVVGNRKETLGAHGYDIVAGPVANDTTLTVINDYMAGTFPREIAIQLLLPQKLTDQYAFCSERSLACLTFSGANSL
ncbi:DUF3990 domain-containing protein [Olsenella sp. YH-ols2217]|uniref:DUF3990 domain-containing protein n=1 Tax=Kribbibacterium absianum TaxID=3044210 RepID=A0ABT6ZLF1_9ACTN|nr:MULTISPECIES: DUF3990 domain-containing protein [unclassified Olsenella]MDJ1121866.1 DUF3990 domain-containing protein [Olsenella sp. YH-ols2216]MDJ1129874.1 DUF3990 domain-containing protein [Olsenella sp. YH-ols2217]